MKSVSALSLVLLATSASASPVITVPLTKLQRTGAYLKGSPDADRARAAFLMSRTPSGPTTVPATNLAYTQYTTSVGIGNPPTYYDLLIDTASSNTFCGTGKPYVKTSTSIPTGQTVSVTYGSGYFSGSEYLDQVAVAPNLVLTNQSIGDALFFADFPGIDGIIGVGPVDLTQGTLSPDINAMVPTVTDNLVSQRLVDHKVLGVYFAPAAKDPTTNGALTFGGADSSWYEGELTYVPVTSIYPAASYWGVDIASSTYGDNLVIPASTPGVVDTGTTQVLLADDFFAVYLNAIPGAIMDSQTGLVEIPESSVPSMQPLSFSIADRVFTMDVAAQLIPTDQNTVWGGVAGKQYGTVANMGSGSGQGLDFILGQKFMERYYTVFDTDTNRVGFAQTKNTFAIHQ